MIPRSGDHIQLAFDRTQTIDFREGKYDAESYSVLDPSLNTRHLLRS